MGVDSCRRETLRSVRSNTEFLMELHDDLIDLTAACIDDLPFFRSHLFWFVCMHGTYGDQKVACIRYFHCIHRRFCSSRQSDFLGKFAQKLVGTLVFYFLREECGKILVEGKPDRASKDCAAGKLRLMINRLPVVECLRHSA